MPSADIIEGNRPVVLDGDQFQRLEDEGFISIAEMVPLAEVEAIRRTLISLFNRNVGYEEGAQFDALGSDDGSEPMRFPQLLQPSRFAPELQKTEFRRIAETLAHRILGSEARYLGDIAMMKPAQTGAATPWHQDEAFADPKFDHRQVTFWLALQETNELNGCMQFMKGSHKGPILPHRPPGSDPRLHALECVGDFDATQAVACPLPPGGCTIHTAQTLHGTEPNRSDQPRLAYVVLFDLVPTPRREPRDFPWQREQVTARAAREKAWRRRGGLMKYLWQRRSRFSFSSPAYAMYAVWRLVKQSRS
jgi:Phytanoyl-CoA dioxygenase (PhyH)